MRPPLLNLILALAGALTVFTGLAVHPSLIVLALGSLISLLAVCFRFEPSQRPRRR